MQETKIIAQTIPGNLFYYSTTNKEFVAEMSDLSKTFDPLSQVWNDSADAGFIMMGQKSDKGMLFIHTDVEYNAEGEITAWLFEADPKFNKEFGLDYTVKAVIVND